MVLVRGGRVKDLRVFVTTFIRGVLDTQGVNNRQTRSLQVRSEEAKVLTEKRIEIVCPVASRVKKRSESRSGL